MIISKEEKINRLADERVHREHEIQDYENNIKRFKHMLANTKVKQLPQHLQQFKGVDTEKIPLIVPLEDIMLVKNSDYTDEIIMRIRTENIELNKVKMIRDAVDAELPKDNKEKSVILANAVTRRNDAMALSNSDK